MAASSAGMQLKREIWDRDKGVIRLCVNETTNVDLIAQRTTCSVRLEVLLDTGVKITSSKEMNEGNRICKRVSKGMARGKEENLQSVATCKPRHCLMKERMKD